MVVVSKLDRDQVAGRERLRLAGELPGDRRAAIRPVSQPSLVVVSGPAGAGKTTLAHKLAMGIGCPAVSRDEIKEGMVHAVGAAFAAAPGDQLTKQATSVFFATLGLLVEARVTVVAEAAFQD